MEELGVKDRILAEGWVRGGVVKVALRVGGSEIGVGIEMVARDGRGAVQEGEGGIVDGPGEFEVRVKGVGKVDELFKLIGARGSADTVISVAEEEVRDDASVTAEEGLFHISYKRQAWLGPKGMAMSTPLVCREWEELRVKTSSIKQ
eukprot:g39585.t1